MSEVNTLPATDEVVLTGEEENLVTNPETADESTSPSVLDENEVTDEPAKKPNGFQRRLQKFERQLTEKEQELEYWKKQAMGATTTKEAPAPVAAKPKLADFDSVEDYVEAREQHLKAELLTQLGNAAQQKQREVTVMSSYETKVREARSELPDWEEVMEDAAEAVTSRETVEFCLESEIGPKIAYHLAKYPEEHERINGLSPNRRIAELGKLEDKLSTKKATEVKKVTSAPGKLSDVKGTGTPVVKDAAKATSYAEWKALDTARKAKK